MYAAYYLIHWVL